MTSEPITRLLAALAVVSLASATQLPPRLSVASSVVRVEEGQKDVVIVCHLDVGDDPIQYKWLKNHLWVTGSLGHSYRGYKQLLLAFHPIRKEHAGNYVCEAKNDAGIHSVDVKVIVEPTSPAQPPPAAPQKTNEALAELAASLSDVLAESDCQCDLYFLLHASPDAPHDLVSVQANLINTIADSVISLRNRVSLMTYSDYVDTKLHLANGTNACALKAAFENLEHQQWATDLQVVLRDVFKKFKKSRSACKVLFLPIVGSAGSKGLDILGSQHLQKAGVKVFVLDVMSEVLPGVAEMASKRGDGKPFYWRVPLPIWPSIVTYMSYMSEDSSGCFSEDPDIPEVCVGEGGACTHSEQCRGQGMGCLQGQCLSLECNVDPTTPGCCAVPGRFWCGDVTRNCTSSESFCDGRVHCMNGRDEDTCWSRPCPASRVAQCESTTLCLALSELCDDHHHCPAGEDEDLQFCKRFPCPPDRPFRCRSGKCIASSKLCDGKFMDCEQGEDETLDYCYGSHRCAGEKSFKCDYGVCIENTAVCDGTYNCLDAADEMMCDRTTCPVARPYKCANGQCVEMDMVCNGHPDGCSDGSDELSCSNFTCPAERSFKCLNGRCIDSWLSCDNNDDCGDSTDELDCPDRRPTYRTSPSANHNPSTSHYPSSTTQRTIKIVCKPNQFTCKNGACITNERVCDGRSNCIDGDDELYCDAHECPVDRPHRCPNSNACVNAIVCNGITDCPDGSDEYDCPPIDDYEPVLAEESGTPLPDEGGSGGHHHDTVVPPTAGGSGHDDYTDDPEDVLTLDEYNYDEYNYEDMMSNNGLDHYEDPSANEVDTNSVPERQPVVPEPSSEPEADHQPEPESEPDTNLAPEVDLVDLVHPDNDNHNGDRHGYEFNPPDASDDTMTMLEEDSNPAASSDRSPSAAPTLHFSRCFMLLPLLVFGWCLQTIHHH